MRASTIHSQIAARDARAVVMSAEDVADFAALAMLGISLDERTVREMMTALDAAPDLAPTMFPATITNPVQFLQAWLPGFVSAVTQVRVIDELIGVSTVGAFEDEEIIQPVMEATGIAQPYSDTANIPLSSWNLGFEKRTVVRFEQGMEVGHLEELRAGRMKVNTAARKRASAALSLEIQRNRVGFYGYNNGAGRTFGFLNDPGLPAYSNVPNGAGGQPGWASKTFLEITADIRVAVGALIVRAGGLLKVSDKMTLALPLGSDNFLSVTSDFGVSVSDWIAKTYPGLRVVTAPELAQANGGVNVFYLYAEKVQDGESDDGGSVFVQAVPTKFKTVGVENRAKKYVEDYANASAGVMVKRPFAIVRYSGI